ncbi:MAG: hypothetical protein AAGG59_03470 [Bacteroidota bacterium]
MTTHGLATSLLELMKAGDFSNALAELGFAEAWKLSRLVQWWPKTTLDSQMSEG